MKSKPGIPIILCVVFLLVNGCIPSIHPIYTKDKLVTLKDLPGIWVEDKGDEDHEKSLQLTSGNGPSGKPERWTFKPGDDKSYLLLHEDGEGLKAAFEVHIIKLGDDYFMDFYPTDMPVEDKDPTGGLFDGNEKVNSLWSIHILPVHTFAKLEITPKELKISMFDPEFLENLLERQQIRIKHEKTDGGFVLTASPEELQKFASKYAHTKEAFLDDPMVLKNKLH